MTNLEKFYVSIFLLDGKSVGHRFTTDPDTFKKSPPENPKVPVPTPTASPSVQITSFSGVFRGFISSMETYRDFIPLTLALVPEITRQIREKEVTKFSEENGRKREDLSDKSQTVYELDRRFLGQFVTRSQTVNSAARGSRLLPEVLIIGLVSAYDGFLASLLKAVITTKPEIVMTSQKEITFKELMEFSSIDDARSSLIEREIDYVMRLSHHDQFDWMQKHFDVKLKENLKVWPAFLELCERRNLFTHTSGVVSNQYLKICRQHKCNISSVNLGQKLTVDANYFREAVNIIYEIGMKLCYVLWRKFKDSEIDKADSEYNQRCIDLISLGSYGLAESLLEFGRKVPRIKDDVRRMMIVNLANSVRLQDRKDEAKKIIDDEDWSATTDEFKMCIASVLGDVDSVLTLMDAMGSREEADNYRMWPVFRHTRDDKRFIEKFEEIYKEPFLSVNAATTTNQGVDESQGLEAPSTENSEPTIH